MNTLVIDDGKNYSGHFKVGQQVLYLPKQQTGVVTEVNVPIRGKVSYFQLVPTSNSNPAPTSKKAMREENIKTLGYKVLLDSPRTVAVEIKNANFEGVPLAEDGSMLLNMVEYVDAHEAQLKPIAQATVEALAG